MSISRLMVITPVLAVLWSAAVAAAPSACNAGVAAGHACHRVSLEARLDNATLGYGDLNDVWGWTDPLDGREYALVGAVHGAVFVDITDSANPRIVGRLPAHEELGSALCKTGSDCGSQSGSTWRNIKVHADHAYVGSEAGGHGLQVFDLRQLRSFPPGSAEQDFTETAHYGGFGHSHTLYIDEASGFLYAVGSDTFAGGPHFVDLAAPAAPVAAGGYSGDGYSHEIVCAVYAGPDARYTGRQICFASNEDTLTILDVTNKSAPVQISRTGYTAVGYTHQGWLSADQRYMFMNDELDEIRTDERLRTLVWDLVDLQAPVVIDQVRQPRFTIDHNNYVHQGFVYQSNYTAGLVILDGRTPTESFEVAFFDTHPNDDDRKFDGTWSNYPFFASGVVAISDITRGLYLVRPALSGPAEDARVTLGDGLGAVAGEPGGVVTPASGGGTFSVSVGHSAEIVRVEFAGFDSTTNCTTTRRTLRCRLPDATPFTWSVTLGSAGGSRTATDIVAMVAGGGDETTPADNRAELRASVSGGGSDGGGGVTDPWLLAGVVAVFAARRRRITEELP